MEALPLCVSVLESTLPVPHAKPPQPVFEGLWAFSPNRDSLGGSSYLLRTDRGNLLIDCPALAPENLDWLDAHGGIDTLAITHRTAIARAQQLQERYGCRLVIQEQEAYLLPEATVTPFEQSITLADGVEMVWTSGHTPGSSCIHWSGEGGVLFPGRHLLPTRSGGITPLRSAKTFHWPRQLRACRTLLDRFSPETLHWLCPGASIGYLKGEKAIADAYRLLAALDFDALATMDAISL